MAKKLILSSVVAAGAALTSYVLIDENRRNEIKQKVKQVKESFNGNDTNLPIEEAGNPELDDIENSDMVAEGSQFGVQYYNEMKEEK
ncbi:hypothetical protein [Alkalibacillus haloalkaliphilus]|uniref:hypothetical protein n=1 Tax=Alkalibacillus haloalkaliphilus TaxID=94136 RepID=UPI00293605CF|nr:hypothetical protein [Alkalibacillus haloalkaliphilus]MDV2582271.1 hypothetical protein [Alkalibacillus haloalkaliphilus]